jgi:hypothetical protein
MLNTYILNRQRITGVLNENTPWYVVTEILQAHSICKVKNIESIPELMVEIKRIDAYKPLTLREPLSERDWRYMASFVNINCSTWTKTTLLEAYNHMINFDRKTIKNIVYGQKTCNNTALYNACMLYSICKEYNITTKWNTTAEQLIQSINNLSLSILSLREQINSYILKANKVEIINLLTSFQKSDTTDVVIDSESSIKTLPALVDLNPSDISESFRKLNDTKYLLSHAIPKSHSDAIILAALIYNVNIIESSSPYDEYYKLQEAKGIQFYVPADPVFKDKFLRNHLWYDLTLNWEPKLTHIYDQEGLKKLCMYEGYENEDFRGYGFEALLQLSRISLNVFLGKNVYAVEEYTPILMDNIDELTNQECITIGNLETKDLKTFSLTELSDHFSTFKEFKNPLNINEVLEKKIINKIKIYASNSNHIRFLEVVEEVENWKKYSNSITKSLRDIYSQDLTVSKILYKILEAGMYMRGWKVSSETYPIKSIATNHMEDKQYQIETNVHTSINDIFNNVHTYSEDIQKVLKTLPLQKYSVNEKTGERFFIVSPDPDDGKSILERLDYVREGDKHKNSKSCIRLSSNIILSSMYYYICALGLNEPFKINELDYIS